MPGLGDGYFYYQEQKPLTVSEQESDKKIMSSGWNLKKSGF